MSGRRRSSRQNNATNILEQQKLDDALKRRAVSNRPAAIALQHCVLSGALCAPVWTAYERYAASSPLLERRLDEAGTSVGAGGRSTRRRAPTIRVAGAAAEAVGGSDGGNSDTLAEALAPAAAAAAAEAARTWEDDGHHCLDLLEPLVAASVTPPKHLQEALMHMVLNAEAHRSNLAWRAYALLERLLEAHPPVKQEGELMIVNEDLWEPVSCSWQAEAHKDKPRLEGLKQAGGLAALVGSAHNSVARAAAAAYESSLPMAPGASVGGYVGDILLLKYWVKLLQADLDVRLAAVRSSGYSREWQGQLENSLVVRLLQTITNWSDGTNSKPLLIRHVAATRVYAHMAGAAGAQLPPDDAAATKPAGGGAAELICGPGEVGQLAGTLLTMLYDAYGALDRMHAFKRQGSIGRENDLVRMDIVMARALTKELPYKEPEYLQVMLHSLPPFATVRVLVYMLADAAYRRLEVGEQLSGGLREVVEHYCDHGVGSPPQVLASDALRFLLDEEQHRGSGTNWAWAAGAVRFNNLPNKAGLALLVTALATAALQQAQWEQRQQRPPARAAEDEDDDGDDEEEGGRGGAEMWAAEAAEVAALYRRAAERMESEGVCGGAAGQCTALAKRCADRLVERLAAGAQRAEGMLLG